MTMRYPALGQRRLMLIVVLIGAAFILFFPARQVVQQRNRIDQLERTYAELRSDNRELDEQVQRLTDKSELEALARQRLFLLRPGEQAYFVEPVKPKTTPAPRVTTDPPWFQNAWDSLVALLRGRN
jgi:cell division protein FtsB